VFVNLTNAGLAGTVIPGFRLTAPLEYHGRVYMITAGGIVTCVDAKTGKVIYRGRVDAPGRISLRP